MSDEEWERAYRDAHRSFYSWPHMERVFKRMAALGSNKCFVTLNRLLAYREAVRLEGVAKLESGIFRIRRRRPERRIENPDCLLSPLFRAYDLWLSGMLITYFWLRRIMFRILADPNRFAYRDAAITPSDDETATSLIVDTRSTRTADRRRDAAKAGKPVREAIGA